MTKELQQALARYEEARINYRSAVRASLADGSKGEKIRAAIQEIQVARAEVARHRPPPRAAAPVAGEGGPWAFVRRFLQAS